MKGWTSTPRAAISFTTSSPLSGTSGTTSTAGSLENRARLLVQVVQEIKRRNGKDFAVTAIINGIEIGQVAGIDNKTCLTPEDSRGIARIWRRQGWTWCR